MTAGKEYLWMMFVSWVHHFVSMCLQGLWRGWLRERETTLICNPNTIYRMCVTLSKHIAMLHFQMMDHLTLTETCGVLIWFTGSDYVNDGILLNWAWNVHMHQHHVSSVKKLFTTGLRCLQKKKKKTYWEWTQLLSWEKSATVELFMVGSCHIHFCMFLYEWLLTSAKWLQSQVLLKAFIGSSIQIICSTRSIVIKKCDTTT